MLNTLQLESKKDYVIVRIDHGKVNAIDTELARELGVAFRDLDADEQVKGVILSGRPHCFSAGLDIMHLGQGGVEGAKEFWRQYLSSLQVMARFSKPFVCAITGYAPAGATILTLTADYRIMGQGEKHKIGMHEFKLSMQIPELLCDVFAYQLGERVAWECVQQAKLFNSDEALALGLVHESVPVEEVLPRAEAYLRQIMGVYAPVYIKSKAYFRKGLLQLMDRDVEAMVEVIGQDLSDPHVIQAMQMFLAGLKK